LIWTLPGEEDGMGYDDDHRPIRDYALLSDCNSAALVSRDGAVEWACLRRFDANSVFGRLLDRERGGVLSIAPVGAVEETTRRYLGASLVLETTVRTATGTVRLLDAFSMHEGGERDPDHHLLRVAEGVEGEVELSITIEPRFDFGELRPLLRHHDDTGAWTAVGGDTALVISGDWALEHDREHVRLSARATVRPGERLRCSVESQLPWRLDPKPISAEEVDRRLEATIDWWEEWAADTVAAEPYAEAVGRSAAVLKGLTCGPTGALVAAPTTSLPEELGGERNWDYRYAWIRDATLVVAAMAVAGHVDAAKGFRDFLLRSAGGRPEDLRIMYGLDGSRHLPEHEVDLDGYRGSRPVRIGNGAYDQTQHDMHGQLLDVAYLWHVTHEPIAPHEWDFLRAVVDRAAAVWRQPDQGIWEVRCGPEQFVHSKALLWTALDRGLRFVEEEGFDGDADRWRQVRDAIRADVDEHGVRDGAFVQHYDTTEVDAALLELPMLGFVAPDDERLARTVERIRDELAVGPHGFIKRYRTEHVDDGLSGDEGVFLMCTFWLVDVLAMMGEIDEAQALFDRLVEVANDVGLYAEQYDPDTGEFLGNFPQAFTHMALINSAHHLSCARGFGEGCREQPWSTADRIGERKLLA
jgi:GH15 family glucan-1,4-alpha-glucosidase